MLSGGWLPSEITREVQIKIYPNRHSVTPQCVDKEGSFGSLFYFIFQTHNPIFSCYLTVFYNFLCTFVNYFCAIFYKILEIFISSTASSHRIYQASKKMPTIF